MLAREWGSANSPIRTIEYELVVRYQRLVPRHDMLL